MHEKLYRESKAREARIEEERRRQQEIAARELTFAPRISARKPASIPAGLVNCNFGQSTPFSSPLAYRGVTVHERLFEEAAARKKRIEVEAQKAELKGCTFKPEVSELAASLTIRGDRLEALYQEGLMKTQEKRSAQVLVPECLLSHARGDCVRIQEYSPISNPDPKDLQECTFRPSINYLPHEDSEEQEHLKQYIEPVRLFWLAHCSRPLVSHCALPWLYCSTGNACTSKRTRSWRVRWRLKRYIVAGCEVPFVTMLTLSLRSLLKTSLQEISLLLPRQGHHSRDPCLPGVLGTMAAAARCERRARDPLGTSTQLVQRPRGVLRLVQATCLAAGPMGRGWALVQAWMMLAR